jgi:uroporphyrinogen decarboxylase
MTSRERLLTALTRGVPDRLPVTTHHLMPAFLNALGGIGEREFFDRYGLDAIRWETPLRPGAGCRPDPRSDSAIESWSHVSDAWHVERTEVPNPGFRTIRYDITTPRKRLSTVLQDDGRTTWVAERLLKEKRDVDVLAAFAPVPLCDAPAVGVACAAIGDRGIVRGAVPGFAIYGQPGCWQDAAALFGIQELILETYEDAAWVDALLGILRDRKLAFVRSTAGAPFDLLESGGGDASSTVISPRIFDRFVAPFDAPIVAAAHEAGQRVVYHTCGGMMPLLERIAGMQPDAMETFTPKDMGGDARLGEAKARIGSRVCMIGGFDQFHYFKGCAPDETRRAVREAFNQAGPGGGFILAPSDHFFEADDALLRAFAEEARSCRYWGQV